MNLLDTSGMMLKFNVEKTVLKIARLLLRIFRMEVVLLEEFEMNAGTRRIETIFLNIKTGA